MNITALQFGLYRDGDNNLDDVQALTIAQALETSATDHNIEFTVEDTTARRGFEPQHVLRTESYSIADGTLSHQVQIEPPHDMAARDNLAKFVARTLDNAQGSNAKETWIDLIDHGGGDGGGLEADHGAGVMSLDDMAGAVAFHRRHGTTRTLISLATAPPEALVEQLGWVADAVATGPGRSGHIIGAHLEGPFLSALRRGAHNPALLMMPDRRVFARFVEAGGARCAA